MSQSQNKTILHFLKTGNYSGAENVAITIITEMKRRYNYKGIYVSLSGDIDTILEKNQIEHAIVSTNSKNEYKRVIDMYQPDVIHAHDFGTSVILSQIKSQALKISHLHNNPPWLANINIKSLIYFWSSRKYKYIFAVSDSVFNEYIFGKLLKNKEKVINNPIDINKIKEHANDAEEYQESDIIFLGRLSTQKNPFRFLDIISECRKEKKDISAIMIGKGELKDDIEEIISEKELTGNVKVLGFKSNPYGYLKHAKILCVPSDWEGFGLVIIEAFALGIPVVATPVGGIKDLVTEATGKLCCTIGQFENEIIRLLRDEEYYDIKSKSAYYRAAELDNVKQYINNIHKYYNG